MYQYAVRGMKFDSAAIYSNVIDKTKTLAEKTKVFLSAKMSFKVQKRQLAEDYDNWILSWNCTR